MNKRRVHKKTDKSYYARQAALWVVRGRGSLPNPAHEEAVRSAAALIGEDLTDTKLRERLQNAVLMNCDDRKRYTFRYLGLNCFSESDFYRRKQRFLLEVYKRL